MIDYATFFESLRSTKLDRLRHMQDAVAAGMSTKRFGDLTAWLEALHQLPTVHTKDVDFETGVTIGRSTDCSAIELEQIKTQLQALIPWRKGPYNVFGIDIDTEWRSDWKWQRIQPHLTPLMGRKVLDVGCGNGYHCWRMFGEGAAQVIGIDPSPRFVVQFYMLKHFVGNVPVDVLPVGIEALPNNLGAFDTTFSMGVFYHRRSPMDHLRELKETLVPGGELVLETLVIDGKLGQVLVPEGRYAMMNNVWFLPSCDTLASWLKKTGFHDIRMVDCTATTTDEQRSTDWMRFHSLADFLDAKDPSLTVEGHPGPKRAVFLARKPL